MVLDKYLPSNSNILTSHMVYKVKHEEKNMKKLTAHQFSHGNGYKTSTIYVKNQQH